MGSIKQRLLMTDPHHSIFLLHLKQRGIFILLRWIWRGKTKEFTCGKKLRIKECVITKNMILNMKRSCFLLTSLKIYLVTPQSVMWITNICKYKFYILPIKKVVTWSIQLCIRQFTLLFSSCWHLQEADKTASTLLKKHLKIKRSTH